MSLHDLIGKEVEFTAHRIVSGNPVRGKLVRISGEWITVVLSKRIFGRVNVWEEGEEKEFRIIMIENVKRVIEK